MLREFLWSFLGPTFECTFLYVRLDCLLRLATTPYVMGQKDAAIVTLDRMSPISWIAHKSVGTENRYSRYASHRKCQDAV